MSFSADCHLCCSSFLILAGLWMFLLLPLLSLGIHLRSFGMAQLAIREHTSGQRTSLSLPRKVLTSTWAASLGLNFLHFPNIWSLNKLKIISELIHILCFIFLLWHHLSYISAIILLILLEVEIISCISRSISPHILVRYFAFFPLY